MLNGMELVSIFVQHRSIMFNMLNGIFQHSTYTCSMTHCSTFVNQQMLNHVSPALGSFPALVLLDGETKFIHLFNYSNNYKF